MRKLTVTNIQGANHLSGNPKEITIRNDIKND